jgi:retron-type reverse transcriptase
MTVQQLALAIGISPRLLSVLAHEPNRHYRSFSLPKKSGGTRAIDAPRFFLKTVQYWISDYLLAGFRIHPCCHAYIRGRSILTNANLHTKQPYVSNLDIKEFFNSISRQHIRQVLIDNGIGANLASTVSSLVTLNSSLPQGAPTSPILSNAFLFDADGKISDACSRLGVIFTRYADDITLSADNIGAIKRASDFVAYALSEVGLRLNKRKTRIASWRASQRVTGLVVNHGVRPPRSYRRSVRSEFNHALYDVDVNLTSKKLDRLHGHLSYLKSFPALADSQEIQRYAEILATLRGRAR